MSIYYPINNNTSLIWKLATAAQGVPRYAIVFPGRIIVKDCKCNCKKIVRVITAEEASSVFNRFSVKNRVNL